MNAEAAPKGGHRATGEGQAKRSTDERQFCSCGYPLVRPRGRLGRVCIHNRHPEEPFEVLVRRPDGRAWWIPIAEFGGAA